MKQIFDFLFLKSNMFSHLQSHYLEQLYHKKKKTQSLFGLYFWSLTIKPYSKPLLYNSALNISHISMIVITWFTLSKSYLLVSLLYHTFTNKSRRILESIMKSLRDEICLWQMKSKLSLDEIKSTHPPSRRISSHECGISS